MEEAVAPGRGGPHRRHGRGPALPADVLADMTPEMKVLCEEVFGPVVTISPYQTFEQALATVNDSTYGLQAGVFTTTSTGRWRRTATLEVGGVIVNDVSAFRADQMPYGGVEGLGVRPRGPAVRDGGDDRAADHGPVARAAVIPSG